MSTLYSSFPKLGEEEILLDSGHTLQMTVFQDSLFGCLGQVDFCQARFGNLIPCYTESGMAIGYHVLGVIDNRRWPVAIEHHGALHVLCTRSEYPDISGKRFQQQVIEYYSSRDGAKFQSHGPITEGSAPWLFIEEDNVYLFFHQLQGRTHHILCRVASSVSALRNAPNKTVHVRTQMHEPEAESAPSVLRIGNDYWMTTEYRPAPYTPWQTLLYHSEAPCGPWVYTATLLDNWRACAFQHILGNQYVLTYSHRHNRKWDIRCRRAPLV